MSLSIDDVRKVAELARLQLGESELKTLSGQLSSILEYVEQLQELNTDGIEPLAHPIELSDVFRADEPYASLPPDAALANAPNRNGDYFSVPAVLD